jgi:quinol monooxygenase YgiN
MTMIIEFMRISVPRGKKEEFTKALASLVSSIQGQPGCLGCHLFQAWPQQNGLHIEARWESHEYLVQYLRSQDYKRLLLLIELSAGPPVVEFFNVLEIRGLDLAESARTSLQ